MLSTRELNATISGESVVVHATRVISGSVISPLLWLMVVDEIICILDGERFFPSGFADDLGIMVEGKFISTLCDRMQRAFRLIDIYESIKTLDELNNFASVRN